MENRRQVLANPTAANTILESLNHLRVTAQIRLLAFCIMPDHWHALFFLLPGAGLSKAMESLSKFTARRLNELRGSNGRLWQDGYYDHRCRNEREIEDMLAYIEHNPVRSGLVAVAEDWPYSSAHHSLADYLDRDWYNQMR